MKTLKIIAKNYFSLFGAEICAKIFAFLSILYLARILEVQDFGKISFVGAILSYFMLFSNCGLATLGTREIARNKNELCTYVSNIFSLRFVLAVCAFLLLVLCAFCIPKLNQMKLLIIFYGLSLFPIACLFDWVFQGLEKMEYNAFAKISNFFLYFLLVVTFIRSHSQLLIIPLFWLFGNIAAALFLILIFKKTGNKINFVWDVSLYKSLLKNAFPMGFSWIMIQIYNNFDTVMLGFLRTDEEVGWYNAAYKIILAVFSLGGFFYISIFPVISRYYKQSKENLIRLLNFTAKLMIIIAWPLGIGGVILAKPVINLFFTQKYDNAIVAFQILIWYVAISFISMIYANSLLACDREKKYALGVGLAALINVILNALLIPPFGLKGAAIATVISELSLFIYSYIEFSKIVQVGFAKYLLKPFLSSALMGIVLYINRGLNLFVLMIAGVIVYAFGLIILKTVSLKELNILKSNF
ncbi:MAG: flippase [Candidatus Omnitrophica bacterium]|nr:flippase [Candidatus Omnitrophota bacterium]